MLKLNLYTRLYDLDVDDSAGQEEVFFVEGTYKEVFSKKVLLEWFDIPKNVSHIQMCFYKSKREDCYLVQRSQHSSRIMKVLGNESEMWLFPELVDIIKKAFPRNRDLYLGVRY